TAPTDGTMVLTYAQDNIPGGGPMTPPPTVAAVRDLAARWQDHPRRPWLDQINAFSMLHQETLLLLNHFAARVQGAGLGIGPYTGGSTVAMAHGLNEGKGGPLFAIEACISYTGHPNRSTSDTIGDLRRNLRAFGVEHVVRIVHGWSTNRRVQVGIYQAVRP